MKSKTKLSVVFLTIVFIIFYTSYKILEPEIRKSRYNSDLDFRVGAAPFDIKEGADVEDDRIFHQIDHGGKMYNNTLTVNEKVLRLEKKYKVDMNHPLIVSPWELAASWVKPREIIPEYCPELGPILKSMATAKIIEADVGYKGTQLKMALILEGGQKVSFKPKWYPRDHVIEGKPYDGADRHNGEIAAFHLARMLGLRRTPLAVGRRVNMEQEIKPVAHKRLLNTFYYQGSDTCFYGICYYCKGKETGVCGEGQFLEGTVILWLPPTFTLKTHRHPWQRTYRDNKKARWETSDDYCDLVKKGPAFGEGTQLLDIVDTTILDYLTGNADRHHYETMSGGKDAMLIIMDNAKSFGNPYYDEKSILAPLYQCCIIRKALYDNLEQYVNGRLSYLLKKVLTIDPISPVLSDPHFAAIDRRLTTVLKEINRCIENNGATQVLIEDR